MDGVGVVGVRVSARVRVRGRVRGRVGVGVGLGLANQIWMTSHKARMKNIEITSK